jgi:hypothetical protein
LQFIIIGTSNVLLAASWRVVIEWPAEMGSGDEGHSLRAAFHVIAEACADAVADMHWTQNSSGKVFDRNKSAAAAAAAAAAAGMRWLGRASSRTAASGSHQAGMSCTWASAEQGL